MFKAIQKFFYLKNAVFILVDLLVINLASFLALFTRFEFSFSAMRATTFFGYALRFSPFNSLICLVVFGLFGLYSCIWQYASAGELFKIAMATFISSAVCYTAMALAGMTMMRSYPILYFLYLCGFVFVTRFFVRFYHQYMSRTKEVKKRTMLIGGGAAAELLIRELTNSPKSKNEVVCIIDDDRAKWGKMIHGIRIVGGREKIKESLEKYAIDAIVLSMPSAPAATKKEIIDLCQQASEGRKLQILSVPSIYKIADGDVAIQQLRPVELTDLLGRPEITAAVSNDVKSYITGKTVLVTGGGGSIGSELVKQVAGYGAKRVVIFDIYENTSYELQQKMKREMPDADVVVRIGSVQSQQALEELFSTFQPQIVFHAAAHKHVPLMEDCPIEAVKNNIIGTYNTVVAAINHHVEKFILISTDKAVNPTNVMGATKRFCEMIIQRANAVSSQTIFSAVRFGNVVGSHGSVVPLFMEQIKNGGPVTVTDKRITRYFMTIPEAVSLVLEAGFLSMGGEIFVLDMGNPVKIDDMARMLITLAGYEPDVDIPIIYTGLRPGEKLYEELLVDKEHDTKTDNDLIFIENIEKMMPGTVKAFVENFEKHCYDSKCTEDEMKEFIRKAVPTYNPSSPS